MIPFQGELFQKINFPHDLRLLKTSQLVKICDELRQFIIDSVSINGGHFAANLGVVELTVALHYVFNTPYDLLVWDVGHQAYGHKILTGRKDIFNTNRNYGGLSGFPKRSESEFDTFGVGHSSTSISAALGMALASKIQGIKDKHHIAIIGDGALTAGLAFEGMDHAGFEPEADLLIILNDNSMAIDPNTGAIHAYLNQISKSGSQVALKDEILKAIGENKADSFKNISDQLSLYCSNFFEDLGIAYFGPVDGHDVNGLVGKLKEIKDIPGPKILHCLTLKGKGYQPAEANQTQWHATGHFDKISGKTEVTQDYLTPKYQEVFGQTLLELARENEKIVAITPAMPSGSSLDIMMKEIPDRVFDVGIAEQHAVTLSAGLATQGMVVFCTIYSTFMQRAYDQVIHDVCIQGLPVIFCLDRAGLVGSDGATHHGAYDIAFMRTIPNMIVASPMNEIEFRNMMFTAQTDRFQSGTQSISIRYPRGRGVITNWKQPFEKMEIGRGRKLRDGDELAILSFGPVGNDVALAIDESGYHVAHYDMRFAKPLDEDLLKEVFSRFKKIITVEDGSLAGGFGSAILEFMNEKQFHASVKRLGIPDRVIEHGSQEQLKRECGYDKSSILEAIFSFFNK